MLFRGKKLKDVIPKARVALETASKFNKLLKRGDAELIAYILVLVVMLTRAWDDIGLTALEKPKVP